MLIRVMYDKNYQDMVAPEELEVLIAERRIIKFKRFSGWVDVRTDRVRKARRQESRVPERRRRVQAGKSLAWGRSCSRFPCSLPPSLYPPREKLRRSTPMAGDPPAGSCGDPLSIRGRSEIH